MDKCEGEVEGAQPDGGKHRIHSSDSDFLKLDEVHTTSYNLEAL